MSTDKQIGKRLFQILDEMNHDDYSDPKSRVGVCNYIISGEKQKKGSWVKVGVPDEVIYDMMGEKPSKTLMLLIIDSSEYEKYKLDNNQNKEV